jgi:hypothetical protein
MLPLILHLQFFNHYWQASLQNWSSNHFIRFVGKIIAWLKIGEYHNIQEDKHGIIQLYGISKQATNGYKT